MSSPRTERWYRFSSDRMGAFSDGERVTVTMANGCQANGRVVMNGRDDYGTTTAMQNSATGETVYMVRITSGSLKGATYYANESQLAPGWASTAALDESCGSGGATADQTDGVSGIAKEIVHALNNPLALTAIAGAIVISILWSRGQFAVAMAPVRDRIA